MTLMRHGRTRSRLLPMTGRDTTSRAYAQFGEPFNPLTPSQPARARCLASCRSRNPFADPYMNLRGRPDRVEGPPGNRTVIDLKTGLAQSDASPEQRRQLLLYAHLVQASTGDLPRQIAIEDAAGRRWQEPITPDLVNAAVAEVTRAREGYKRAESRGALPTLARPAPDTCRWCPYRPVCEPYWANLEKAWRHGSVAGMTTSDSAGSTIEINAASPADSSGRRWIVSAAPASVVAAARPIAVVDAEVTGAAEHLRWKWRTTAWMLDPARAGGNSKTHRQRSRPADYVPGSEGSDRLAKGDAVAAGEGVVGEDPLDGGGAVGGEIVGGAPK
jgi:hypothetical protein